jgi:hypothetical protein
MAGYTKLFQKILDSTIWMEDDKTRIIWIAMLAMANQDGIVESSLPGLAHRARVDVESCRSAIAKFLAPENDSNTKEFGGRRIEAVDGGWKLLNHKKYRDMLSLEHRREYKRIKAQQYREEIRQMNKGKNAREIIRDKIESEKSLESNETKA